MHLIDYADYVGHPYANKYKFKTPSDVYKYSKIRLRKRRMVKKFNKDPEKYLSESVLEQWHIWKFVEIFYTTFKGNNVFYDAFKSSEEACINLNVIKERMTYPRFYFDNISYDGLDTTVNVHVPRPAKSIKIDFEV